MSSIFGDVCWLLEDLAFTARYKGMNLINRIVFPQPQAVPRSHDMYRFSFFDGPQADRPQVVSPRVKRARSCVAKGKSSSSPRSTSPTPSISSTTPSTSTSYSTISSTPSRPLMSSGRPSLSAVSPGPAQSTTSLGEMAPTALATFTPEVREKRIKRFIHDATATRIINHEEIVIIVKLEGMKRVGGPKPKRRLWFW
ncbi:hypothetical protein T439DRAFT_354353 [Meredithblackwellia eburnea MCA 4105]